MLPGAYKGALKNVPRKILKTVFNCKRIVINFCKLQKNDYSHLGYNKRLGNCGVHYNRVDLCSK